MSAAAQGRCLECDATRRELATHTATGDLLCLDCYLSRTGSEGADGNDPATYETPRDEAIDQPPTLGALLAAIQAVLSDYVVLPDAHASTALTLYVAHTYALEGAHATPYLLLVSPEKRSGKTRLLEVLELLVARPWRVAGGSEAAMFRKIAAAKPTLLLDEIDAIFSSGAERTEPLRAILNAGNRPGVSIPRCIGPNRDTVEDYEVYCPKVLAGIDTGHRIPDTIRDRAITISMVRRTRAEPVAPYRYRDLDAHTEPLRKALAAWAETVAAELAAARPACPPALDDRAAEAWEPLLAIADLAGDSWPERAREAAEALSGFAEAGEQTVGTLLLGAIREAFGARDRIRTAELLQAINGNEELPFGAWRGGKGLDGRTLAKLLQPYGEKLKPRSIRIGDDASGKGYLREQFSEVWERWLPAPRQEAARAAQAAQARAASAHDPHQHADVPDVPDVPDESRRPPDVPDTQLPI